MLRWLIRKRLARAETRLGASLDYLRHIADVSLMAFFKFITVMPMATYRRSLAADAYHVARIVATRHEDCATCLQIEVNLAKRAGVKASLLRAVADADTNGLPDGVAEAYRFVEAIVTQRGEDEQLRERVRLRYGEAALIELAMAVAACRVFPTVRRALGYSTSCVTTGLEPQVEHASGGCNGPQSRNVLRAAVPSSGGADTRGRNVELIEMWYQRLWNQWDKSALKEIASPDIVLRGSLGRVTRGYTGVSEYMEFVRAALPDFTNCIEEIISEGDKAFARLTYRGTLAGGLFGRPRTRRTVSYAGAAVFTFEKGRIRDVWVLGDVYGLLRQREAQ